MTVRVYTKFGKEIRYFTQVDGVREYEGYYEITFEGDKPYARVYGKDDIILIYS